MLFSNISKSLYCPANLYNKEIDERQNASSRLQGVKILFNPIFLEKSYFVLFFGKCPILSYFLAIFPLILVFIVFLSPLFHARTFLKNFLPHFARHQNTFSLYHARIHFLKPFPWPDALLCM